MNNEFKKLSVFENVELGEIRTVLIDEAIYFVGNDVANVLEYARPREAISAHCKGAVSYSIPTNGGRQETKIIPEGDLYRLIFKAADQSKNLNIKEKAEKFERWIFDEVLPTIRKHGAYITEDVDEEYVKNELRFSKNKTIKTFSSATPSEITQLYSEFKQYIDVEYKYKTDERIARYRSVEKGLENLHDSTASLGVTKIGDCYNIQLLKEQVIFDRTKLGNRMSGGEKGVKTKTINKLTGHIEAIESQLQDAIVEVVDLKIQLDNSIPYPAYNEFIKLNIHGISNNYLFEHKNGGTFKTDTYKNWINRFPLVKMPVKEFWNVDWTKPIEIFLHYVALARFDHTNCDKAIIDHIIQRVYKEDDNIVHRVHSERIGTCNDYTSGEIHFHIRNVL